MLHWPAWGLLMFGRVARLLVDGLRSGRSLTEAWDQAANGQWQEADAALAAGMRPLRMMLPDAKADFQLNLLYLQIRFYRGLSEGVNEAYSVCLTQVADGKVDSHLDRRNYLITYMARLADSFAASGTLNAARQAEIQSIAVDRPFDVRRVPGFIKSRYPVRT